VLDTTIRHEEGELPLQKSTLYAVLQQHANELAGTHHSCHWHFNYVLLASLLAGSVVSKEHSQHCRTVP
jgi:hypothetical protein